MSWPYFAILTPKYGQNGQKSVYRINPGFFSIFRRQNCQIWPKICPVHIPVSYTSDCTVQSVPTYASKITRICVYFSPYYYFKLFFGTGLYRTLHFRPDAEESSEQIEAQFDIMSSCLTRSKSINNSRSSKSGSKSRSRSLHTGPTSSVLYKSS